MDRDRFVGRRLAVAYFALQAVLAVAWCGMLGFSPAAPVSSRWAFALPEAALIVVGSIAAAVFIVQRSKWSLPISFVVAGVVDCVVLHRFATTLLTGGSWLGVLLMTPAALLSTVFALLQMAERTPVYRRAAPASTAWNVGKTVAQITFFWGTTLALLPLLLVRIDPLPRFLFAGQVSIAFGAFVILGTLGIWTGVTMARLGQGTPLPLDAPRALVIAGPYAYVRNPMAVTGIGQGFCVGVLLGSWLVIAYVLFGALVWNYIVRPSEEDDLEQQFGASFARYRDNVRCWWPRTTRYE